MSVQMIETPEEHDIDKIQRCVMTFRQQEASPQDTAASVFTTLQEQPATALCSRGKLTL